MSKKTLYLLGIFLTIVIGALLYYIFGNDASSTSIKEKSNSIEESTSLNVTKNPFSITDGTFKATALENFNFKGSNFSISQPISSDISLAIENLKGYLTNNPSKSVDISGMYTSHENNTSELENLGLARANSIKDYLVSLGFSADKINIKSELNDALIADKDNNLFGPLAFNLTNLANSNTVKSTNPGDKETSTSSDNEENNKEDSRKEAYNKLKGTSFTLYFETGKSSVKLSKEQQRKLEEFSNAAKSLGLKISVTGHTDSDGSRTFNNKLGKQRADFVKNQLLKKNSKNQIKTFSKGEDNPTASNSTDEGKSKNRRTVITIN